MTYIKLKEFCEQNSITYITGYRWFKAGQIEGAYQTDSGTILIPYEKNIKLEQTNDAMSVFLKKTVEFSKNNSSVEDFAAYVISNFQLRLNGQTDNNPRYSKNKPKPEEVQKHFQQFLPDKEKTEQLKAVKNALKQQESAGREFQVDELNKRFVEEPATFSRTVNASDMKKEEFEDMAAFFSSQISGGSPCGPLTATATGSLVGQSVDFNTTPQQQINYTGSNNNPAFDGSSSLFSSQPSITTNCGYAPFSGDVSGVIITPATDMHLDYVVSGVAFQPTQKELLSAIQVIEVAETEEEQHAPRKRGRKPTIKRDKL